MSINNLDAIKAKANLLKEDGNKYDLDSRSNCLSLHYLRFFQKGDFKQAEELYGKAILKDSSNAKFFTNRAMARIKLQAWDGCMDDCIKAIELEKNNMKAYFYLAEAQLGLRHPNEAHTSALKAYEECIRTSSPSTGNASTLVLRAKKEKWEARERDRIRRRSALLSELEDGLDHIADYNERKITAQVKSGEISYSEGLEQIQELEESSRKNIEDLRNAFALSDPENLQRRVCSLRSIGCFSCH